MTIPMGRELRSLLSEAAGSLRLQDVEPYVRLREFVLAGMTTDQSWFVDLFSKYYGLNAGGLGPNLKVAYFRILFQFAAGEPNDPHSYVLRELYRIPNAQGRHVLAGSFASKLVSIHDEAQPIYDRHVARFFGIERPPPGPLESRIAQFIADLRMIKAAYDKWGSTPEIAEIIQRSRKLHQGLNHTHPNRICDFLVWVVGARKLLRAD